MRIYFSNADEDTEEGLSFKVGQVLALRQTANCISLILKTVFLSFVKLYSQMLMKIRKKDCHSRWGKFWLSARLC